MSQNKNMYFEKYTIEKHNYWNLIAGTLTQGTWKHTAIFVTDES